MKNGFTTYYHITYYYLYQLLPFNTVQYFILFFCSKLFHTLFLLSLHLKMNNYNDCIYIYCKEEFIETTYVTPNFI